MKQKQLKNMILCALCIAFCVVLPMAFHGIPNAGKVFCPMHIPVLLCGLIAGWQYGIVCGLTRTVFIQRPDFDAGNGIPSAYDAGADGVWSDYGTDDEICTYRKTCGGFIWQSAGGNAGRQNCGWNCKSTAFCAGKLLHVRLGNSFFCDSASGYCAPAGACSWNCLYTDESKAGSGKRNDIAEKQNKSGGAVWKFR